MDPMKPLSRTAASSFEEVVVRSRPALGSVLQRFRIPPADAEDLLQDSFVRFLRKRAEVADPERWLIGALQRECLHYWRSRSRRLLDLVDETVLDLVEDETAVPAERAVLHGELRRVFHRLREGCRSLLALRYGMGCERAEAADRLGYSRASVDKLTRRCLDALGRHLVGLGGGSRHD